MKLFINIMLWLLVSLNLNSQVYLDIDIHQAKDTIAANMNNSNFTILDVRTAAEYLPEHIEGAFYRDFYATDFELQLDSLDKSRTFLIYCRSGNRSGQTLALMEQLGFETVYNMLGGMNEWNNANYPVTDVIPSYVDIYASTTNITEEEKIQIFMYPNPTFESFYVEIPHNNSTLISYKLISAIGVNVKSGEINSFFKVDISTVDAGIYNLILFDNNNIINSANIIKL